MQGGEKGGPSVLGAQIRITWAGVGEGGEREGGWRGLCWRAGEGEWNKVRVRGAEGGRRACPKSRYLRPAQPTPLRPVVKATPLPAPPCTSRQSILRPHHSHPVPGPPPLPPHERLTARPHTASPTPPHITLDCIPTGTFFLNAEKGEKHRAWPPQSL